jgi:hypothetical protein
MPVLQPDTPSPNHSVTLLRNRPVLHSYCNSAIHPVALQPVFHSFIQASSNSFCLSLTLSFTEPRIHPLPTSLSFFQPGKQSLTLPVCHSFNHSAKHSVSHSARQAISHSLSLFVTLSIIPPGIQSFCQAGNLSLSLFVTLSFTQPGIQTLRQLVFDSFS